MSVVASMARRLGLAKLVVPTQGNAGDSLAAYGLAAGLEVAVVMPADTPMAILGRVAALAARDARLRLDLVEGTIREAGVRVREHWVPRGWFSVATFQEPGWRIEGKKTLGLELAEPVTRGGRWRLPDVIVYPTGGGTGLLGMWKAFAELEALGLVGTARPRMIAVQSEATRPLVEAMAAGAADTAPGPAGATLAVGLNVPGGVGHFRVLQILRASGGGAVAVGEAEMAATHGRARRELGLALGPEGAACLAALPQLVSAGLVRAGERVVAVNTGAAEKYLPDVLPWLERD
jgi:threonine synthase